jgi:hypothetical protein
MIMAEMVAVVPVSIAVTEVTGGVAGSNGTPRRSSARSAR